MGLRGREYKIRAGAVGGREGNRARATPDNYLNTHPSAWHKSLYWLLVYAGGLKLNLSYI